MSSGVWNRRGFLKKSVVGSLTYLVGANIVHAASLPKGVLPLGVSESQLEDILPGKHKDLIFLNNRPWNVETPPHLLDDKVTPADKMFVRNNGIPPETIDLKNWKLTIDGESAINSKSYSIDDLKNNFKHYSYQLTLECGGNGRAGYYPPASGNQWTEGAVSCGKWTGVRLKDVLKDVGVKEDAVYIGYYGKDTHISGAPDKKPISRGVPISKAMEDEALIAWAMNDEDIPAMNGYPLRLVIGGWPASTSGKWLERISIRNIVHDGPKMTGTSYRVPKNSVAPGEKVAEEDFKIIETMPVKSLITYPKTGAVLGLNKTLKLRGHAWAGDLEVSKVQVSTDFGATWKVCQLEKPVNRLAWQHWSAEVDFPKEGYYEVWAKATDSEGKSQPMVIPGWNPKGYLNNSCHRIAVKIEG
ncbi:sulfite oxidase [Arcticibacterium luteifluviistationis]|uniref:Molybdopterin containing oxidoreductase n=1 Tax=Arcticibacterium luteifluviistationis TaxID=1784714 RepID=A0A2Z4GFG4_9BACT|nr:sulfite oxidase [Arcticibacterium luteifluviistationis]AWV99980.1 molybdopterin containing oxidoreductase [Arcticibacterium luteifluviistationis]